LSLQFGIKEVYNLNIADFVTNKPFIYVDYAEASTNENNGERTDLRGGQGNYKLLGFDHTKDSTLSLTLPLVDLKMLALLAGDDLVEGAADVYKREELTVVDNVGSKEITLTDAPTSASTLVVNALDGERDFGTEYVATLVSGNTYSLTGATTGEVVTAFYQYATPATARKISIKANKFPKTVKIYGDGLWRDQVTETDKAIKMTVHKAKPQLNYTLTTSSSDATTLEVTFDMYALKDADGDMSYIDYVIL
jgi:hypothetical protein